MTLTPADALDVKNTALGPIMETRADLLALWAQWDATPGNRDAADAVSIAFGAHSSQFGFQANVFRDVCNCWRRAGYTREQALAATEAGCTSRGFGNIPDLAPVEPGAAKPVILTRRRSPAA